ncbi:MAG: hypothetical protein KIS87_09085 [Phycisphaeraceae bacterium]|nr:hypothetical protein [Phycisphaeraceae bacterium]
MDEHLSMSPQDESGAPTRKQIARVDVRGKDPALWANLRTKLLARINDILDRTADHERGTTIREEARQFTSALLDFARSKLAREGAEVQKIEAEVGEIYAKRLRTLAEADKLSAEAEAQRLRNSVTELCTALALTKAMLVGEEGEEALLLGRQIDEFLVVVRELGLVHGV